MQSHARAAWDQLQAIYAVHAPQKACNIGPLLAKFAGREAELVSKVRAKYCEAASPVAQTSSSHPIRVSWVVLPAECGGGKLGLCFCPGKQLKKSRLREGHRDEDGRPIRRSLKQDLARLRAPSGGGDCDNSLPQGQSRSNGLGCQCLVCLLNTYELRTIGIRCDYAGAVREAGMDFISFPIIEGAASATGGAAMDVALAAREVVDPVVARLRCGQTVVMHCRGGVGRAGMLAACVLLRVSAASCATDAVALVRQRRCRRAVETSRQNDFVRAYSHWLAACSDDNDNDN